MNTLNKLLSAITFVPQSNYFGFDAKLRITIDDLGNHGLGGTKRDSMTVPLIIRPVNDAPSITTVIESNISIAIFTLEEGTVLHLTGADTSLLRKNVSLIEAKNNAFKSGMEVWKFVEPDTSSTLLGASYGPGRLDWTLRELADINPGPASSHPKFYTNYKSMIYYQADDGVHGPELWRDFGILENVPPSDSGVSNSALSYGSVASQMFSDFYPGSTGSAPSYLAVHNDILYFATNGIDTSWMTLPQHRDGCNSFRQSQFDNRIRFAVSESPKWLPGRVYDCPSGYRWVSTKEGVELFTSNIYTNHNRFWHSEAEAEVGQRHGPQIYNFQNQDSVTPVENDLLSYGHESKVYFQQCGWKGLEWWNETRIHFRFSDSHVTGAYKHAGKPESFIPDYDLSFWKSGEFMIEQFAGIVCVLDSWKGSSVVSEGGVIDVSAGSELWRSDGTVEGSYRISDIYPGPQSSNPAFLISFGSYLYFVATNDAEGRELWRSQGEINDAELVATDSLGKNGIYPGPHSSDPADLIVVGRSLMFAATDYHHGREVWLYSYPEELNVTVNNFPYYTTKDIVGGRNSSNPNGFAASSGDVFPVLFQASNDEKGAELWMLSDLNASPVLVKDICSGSGSSNPRYITHFRGLFFFQADDCVHGIELWRSDGTSNGTYLLKDIRPGTYDSSPSYLTVMTSRFDHLNYLYFAATDGRYVKGLHDVEGIGGSQVWRTDGTTSGTSRAFDRSENDVYFDFSSLDAAYPARFGVFKSNRTSDHNQLYISASYGNYDYLYPHGGFNVSEMTIVEGGSQKELSRVSGFSVSQVALIDDVDTHPERENITCILSVDKGLLVLRDSTATGINSVKPLRFIIIETKTTDRDYLMNALLDLGHLVDIFSDAESGMEAIQRQYLLSRSKKISTPDLVVYPYDCLIVGLNIGSKDISSGLITSLDGLEVIRAMRFWESQAVESDPDYDSLTIVAMSKRYEVLNDKEDSLSAGADLYLLQPETDYQSAHPGQFLIFGKESVKVSFELYAKKVQRSDYLQIGEYISDYMYRYFRTLNITAILEPDQRQVLPLYLSSLPGRTIGHTIILEGNISSINEVLRDVFYFSPNNTLAIEYVNLTVTAIDYQKKCPSQNNASQTLPSNDSLAAYIAYSSFEEITGNERNLYNQAFSHFYHRRNVLQNLFFSTSPSFNNCVTRNYLTPLQTTKTIPIYVIPVNQPPIITIFSANLTVNSSYSTITTVRYPLTSLDLTGNVTAVTSPDASFFLPKFTLSDTDVARVSLVNEYGVAVQPSYYLSVEAKYGRLTWYHLLPGVKISSGTGFNDRRTVLQGPIDLIVSIVSDLSNALSDVSFVQYTCRSLDGCVSGLEDIVTIEVNDLGIYGKGGPKSTVALIYVSITSSS